MNWMKEIALITAVNQGMVKVQISKPTADQCGSCSGCTAGKEKQAAGVFRVPVADDAKYSIGDIVHIRHAVPPFALSVFLLFILPLIFMAGFPLVLWAVSADTGERPALIALAVALGLGLAFGINYGIDRAIRKKYPTSLSPMEDCTHQPKS